MASYPIPDEKGIPAGSPLTTMTSSSWSTGQRCSDHAFATAHSSFVRGIVPLINSVHEVPDDRPGLIASTLSIRSTSSGHHPRYRLDSHRPGLIHAIDSIHIVRASSHPRYRLDPHRLGLIASTLSTRSTSSGSHLIHAIDSIHIVQALSIVG